MDVKFISNKPWIDEIIRLRKALFFTTLFVLLLGLAIAIVGIVLLAYFEFVVGVIAIVFGILLPLGYVGANALMFYLRQKDYDKSTIIEYRFTDDALEIIKLTDSFKSKDVISYSNMRVNKVINKSKFLMLRTKGCYTDYIILRKADMRVADGVDKAQAVVDFVSILIAKIAEATRANEITCADPIENVESPSEIVKAEGELDAINRNDIDNVENVSSSIANDKQDSNYANVKFEDLTEKDENVDIEDEKQDVDTEVIDAKYEIDEGKIENKD